MLKYSFPAVVGFSWGVSADFSLRRTAISKFAWRTQITLERSNIYIREAQYQRNFIALFLVAFLWLIGRASRITGKWYLWGRMFLCRVEREDTLLYKKSNNDSKLTGMYSSWSQVLTVANLENLSPHVTSRLCKLTFILYTLGALKGNETFIDPIHLIRRFFNQ